MGDPPAHILDSDAAEGGMRELATDLADTIRNRVDAFAETALTDQPEWTHTFGPEPADPTRGEALENTIRLAAAHRDQHDITDNDPANPLGPYPTTGHAGHREWWASASAVLARNVVDDTATPTGLGATVEQHLAGAIARDLYNAVPETERPELHTALATILDPVTAAALERAPETISGSPASTTALLSALAETGHLTPRTAADLGITKPHLDENQTQTSHPSPSAGPEVWLPEIGQPSGPAANPISGPRLV